MQFDLYERFEEALNKYNMLDVNDKVLVAVSGGPDSMALLHLFWRWNKNRVGVFHLNHQFRPEAEEDAFFVKKIATEWDLTHHIMSYDILRYLEESGETKQQGARTIRYRLMEELRQKYGYTKVALGHHADDQAETVLMRIVRGTGLTGLAGIPAVRNHYIRPLLCVNKEELINYCNAFSIPFVIDDSNKSTVYFRNKIRNHLIPILEKDYNVAIRDHLVKLAQMVHDDDEELEERAKQIFTELELESAEPKQISIDRERFRALSPSMQRRVLRKGIADYKGDLVGINFEHIEELRNRVVQPGTFEMDLPSIVIIGNSNTIVFGGYQVRSEWEPFELNIPSTVVLGRYKINARVYSINELPQRQENAEDYDYQKLVLPLVVRRRQPGDRIEVFGAHNKKVKDLLIDHKIPVQLRDEIPIICDQTGILYIPGVRRSEKGRISPATREVLRLTFEV
ncbi:MAG: tRNA lysidine(34) synthetase TilS [Firmicutes bacterium]|nr:tRNA lysidine(34) synthetase TilS [Bacillota bacterium]